MSSTSSSDLGAWEEECLRDGVIRFGYQETPHDLCIARRWDEVRDFWAERRGNATTATNDVRQIRTFYESTESSLFITFAQGLLHWCRPSGPVEVLATEEGNRRRATVDGWHSKSIGGQPLSSDRLSGNLLKVQMFKGTICKVKQRDYLLRKLNDELSPEVMAAEEAEGTMIAAIVGLMRLLTWQDFELLVDLISSASGWRRVGIVGGVQKTLDLELLLPSTGWRAFVQIKSQATPANLRDYAARFTQADIYQHMFFVWHTGSIADEKADGITLIEPERLARMCHDAGLASWLRDKASWPPSLRSP